MKRKKSKKIREVFELCRLHRDHGERAKTVFCFQVPTLQSDLCDPENKHNNNNQDQDHNPKSSFCCWKWLSIIFDIRVENRAALVLCKARMEEQKKVRGTV
jgi:hypothetical protein